MCSAQKHKEKHPSLPETAATCTIGGNVWQQPTEARHPVSRIVSCSVRKKRISSISAQTLAPFLNNHFATLRCPNLQMSAKHLFKSATIVASSRTSKQSPAHRPSQMERLERHLETRQEQVDVHIPPPCRLHQRQLKPKRAQTSESPLTQSRQPGIANDFLSKQQTQHFNAAVEYCVFGSLMNSGLQCAIYVFPHDDRQ